MCSHLWTGFVILAAVATTALCDDDLVAERKPRIFAYYSTTKMTKLKTVTITGISTCISTAKKSFSSAVCTGRKRRSMALQALNDDKYEADTDLDSTIESSDYVRERRSSDDDSEAASQLNREEEAADVERVKRALTIWSTNYETLTLTSTAKISKYTLTASVFCTTAGFKQSCFF